MPDRLQRLLFLLPVLLISAAAVPTAADDFVLQTPGYGMSTCGSWVDQVRSSPADHGFAFGVVSWLHGFVAGVEASRKVNLLHGADPGMDLNLRLMAYCTAHRADAIGTASVSVTNQLVAESVTPALQQTLPTPP